MRSESAADAIRQVIAEWARASRNGDADTLSKLMTEDVVFLIAGQQTPMRGREAFMAAAQGMAGKIQINPSHDIKEIEVDGDLAYCWSTLTVTMTPSNGAPMKNAGNVLSIFKKQPNGKWALHRDANMLMRVE